MQIFLIGLIFFCLGYFLCNFFSIDKYIKFNIFKENLKIKNTSELLVVSLILNFITFFSFFFLKIHELNSQFVELKIILIYMVIGFNFFIYLKLNTFFKYLFFIPVFIIIFLEFFSGSISFPFMLMLYLYFLFFCFKKKIFYNSYNFNIFFGFFLQFY